MNNHQKNNKKVYTLILIPGKYGNSKTFNISCWLIPFITSIILISAFLSILLFYKYAIISKTESTYKDNIQCQKATIENQQNELDKLKTRETEVQKRLDEMKTLEDQMQKRLKTNTSSKNNTSVNSNNLSLLENVDYEIVKINSLFAEIDKAASVNSRIPHMLPCNGLITSYFGLRTSPTSSRGRTEEHTGIDIANSYRTPVKAAADGVVEYAGWLLSYGNAIIINHQNGYSTLYGHNSKLLVKKGSKVKGGQVISLMGSTGRSTGTHVHFEIRLNNIAINPLKLIRGGN